MTEINNTNFTKSDFLTALQFSKLYGLDRKKVYDLMNELFKRNISFAYNMPHTTAQTRPIIIEERGSHGDKSRDKMYKIHPFAHEEFFKYFTKKYPDAVIDRAGAEQKKKQAKAKKLKAGMAKVATHTLKTVKTAQTKKLSKDPKEK